ncbi:WXG100 family type VII secretion target [Streptomyces luteolus]|uniref:WXG100 family type VII secretion target n=1 Tax=Streptomyces luteolus TaxID=3043615 RepID=A0ABT6SQQ7_9ACTN|nr:WXG100 family type VII secretion target [Streptomyces sp. B-S-A12]MDI3417932.1 WXG100 family type VII secretion target [Streptomyces sp. B-S-A12]
MVGHSDLKVSHDDLTRLADELHDMQGYLERQVRRMDGVVDGIEAGWSSPTAKAYRKLHNEAAEDAVRIRDILRLIEQAVRMSRDNFTEQEVETLQSFRQIEARVDVAREAAALSTPNSAEAAPAPPRSGLADFD